ncbi:MAG TPA: TonB family protein [Devosia sp.]|jgi:protein TonB|uniref:energy transducer TonB family protein n=1 Tax=Devosia sp. TaxID=1871048 RepID=UPI002DDCD180|nr:TonB family protein [Devosia sp.]HEV2516308.1 TonB family protein [Devosia sp.]
MKKAALASAGIHIGLIAGAFVFLNLEPAIDETAAESVAVEIISVDTATSNPTEEISEATETLVSAGAEVEAEDIPETAEAEVVEVAEAEPAEAVEAVAAPVEVAEVTPTESEEIASAEVLTAAADPIAPVEAVMPQMVDAAAAEVADSVAPSQSDPLEVVRTATLAQLTPEPPTQQIPPALVRPLEVVKPLETASLAPVVEEELEVAPIPKPRIVRKPVAKAVEPTREQPKEQPPEKPKKAEKPAEKKPQKKPPSKQASLGNGGNAAADSAAKKSGGGAGKKNDGGSAAASKYPGLVQAKVTRAAKYPSKARGDAGEALVSFTVGASGTVTKVALARSSGNAALDTAALAAVDRAAPFPPIPEAAGRSSWSFTVPVYFKK